MSKREKYSPLTAQRLRDVLEYDPLTGHFKWRVNFRRARAGVVAGSMGALGYRIIGLLGTQWKEHRLAFLYMTGTWPKGEIDHINHDRSDNRWSNLRDVDPTTNKQNQKQEKVKGTSSYKGVYWCSYKGKWRAQIKANKKCMSLGFFDNPESARTAYLNAKRVLHPLSYEAML